MVRGNSQRRNGSNKVSKKTMTMLSLDSHRPHWEHAVLRKPELKPNVKESGHHLQFFDFAIASTRCRTGYVFMSCGLQKGKFQAAYEHQECVCVVILSHFWHSGGGTNSFLPPRCGGHSFSVQSGERCQRGSGRRGLCLKDHAVFRVSLVRTGTCLQTVTWGHWGHCGGENLRYLSSVTFVRSNPDVEDEIFHVNCHRLFIYQSHLWM